MSSQPPTDPVQRVVTELLAARNQVVERVLRWQRGNQLAVQRTLEQIREPVDRLNTWVATNRPQILAFVENLQEFQRRGEAIRKGWDQSDLAYLVAPLDATEQMVLALHATPGDTAGVIQFFEDSLARPEFIGSVCTALDEAQILTDTPRGHLKHGLGHLQHHELFEAWPPLIIGLEGAFVDVAIAAGYAVRRGNHVHLASADGSPLPTKISSVEGVAKSLGHGSGESGFGDFLVRHVYGGEGNPFRHGTAHEGVRERTICLAVAVIGWLDVFVTPGSLELLRDAVRAELERLDEPPRQA